MEPSFQRARQPEQKAARRAQLLATARGMLEAGVELRDLSLNELARRTGMAKANVYRYFESREALLLEVLRGEWRRWFEGFSPRLRRGPASLAALEALASRLARSLAAEPLLCALTAALPTVLEQNLSEATVRAFKRESLAFFGEIAAALERACPRFDADDYAALLLDCAHAIVGLYPATHPAASVRAAIAGPELGFFRLDFARELERFVRALAADRARGGARRR